MAWFGLAKIALQAGSKIYANRQRAKVAMSDAQLFTRRATSSWRGNLPGKITRSPTDRSQGRIRFGDFIGAHNNFGLGGLQRQSGSSK